PIVTPCAAFSNQRERGFSNAARIASDFSLTPPAQSHQPPSPLPLSPLARSRSPHPAANRFVQEAFRIGVAMRKALSICGPDRGKTPRNGVEKRRFLGESATWLITAQLLFETTFMSRVAFHESQARNRRKFRIHINLRRKHGSPNF